MDHRSYQALLCAFFILAFFTLDSRGLSRVDHRTYHPANTTFMNHQQRPWNPQPGRPPNWQGSPVTTRSPGQASWNSGGNGGNYNQWNRYNATSPRTVGQNNLNHTNQWTYNDNNHLNNNNYNYNNQNGSWNTPQRPLNQSHLYPRVPTPSPNQWNNVRQTTPPTYPQPNHQFNNNQNHWNNSNFDGNANNWWTGNNKTRIGNAVLTTPQPGNANMWRNPLNNPQDPTGGLSSWNQPSNNNNNNNNFGWSGTPITGQTLPATNPSNTPQNNWRSSNGPNYNNWQAGVPDTTHNNNNQANGGPALAPIGGQLPSSPPNGIPLAPIGFPNPAQNFNGGGGAPNDRNYGNNNGNSGSSGAQLAPLAPLSYGGAANPNQRANNGNSNPYANMFN